MIRKHTQQGVALIFALGILSLILVMGVAFLGNALIVQKIAVNSRETAASRYFAENALNRALSQLALFNLLQSKYHASFYASDAESVYSRAVTAAASASGDTGTAVIQDQLSGSGSKLNVNSKFSTPWYEGKKSPARWIYVHENGKESDGSGSVTEPITGRFAYQVLPQSSTSRISLYGVTSGVTGIAGETPAASNPRIPHTNRWGIDADELVIPNLGSMFSQYWGTGVSPLLALPPQHEFDNFLNLLSGSSAPNPFKDNTKTVENRKRWLRHIFVEGKRRVAREAYSDGAAWYPRFNLSDFTGDDVWYSRFLKDGEFASVLAKLKNNANIADGETYDLLKRLSAPPGTADEYRYSDGCVDDSKYDNPIGLPFLRAIGSSSEKPSFLKADGTIDMESFRRQIAANLNDYCDSDSIPTSNIPASIWKTLCAETDGSKLPAYTGNEKTPYINELAFGFRMTEAGFASGAKYEFKAKVDPEVIAELINVYRKKTETAEPAANCKLYGAVKYMSLTLKVTITGTAKVTWKKSDSEYPTETYTLSTDDEREVPIISTVTPFDISGFSGSGPYWVKNHQFSAAADIAMDLSEKIKSKHPTANFFDGKTVTDYKMDPLTAIKVEITKVTFDLGHLVLTDTSGTETGIDFVKVASPPGTAKGYELALTPSLDLFGELSDAAALGTQTSGDKCIFHLGSIQAIDPRQNLNLNFEQARQNDWYRDKDPSLLIVEDKSGWAWTNFASRITGGKVNVNSNPSAPKYADGSDCVCDAETTEDPAWQGDAADKHISTAVIRNKPMRSPWELGFIHRGLPFQTINLKSAGGIDDTATLADDAHEPANFSGWTEEKGTKYEHGDAGILDQIKMTEYNKSWGKVDISVLRNNAPAWWIATDPATEVKDLNKNLFLSLFQNQRHQQPWQFLAESDSLTQVPADLTQVPRGGSSTEKDNVKGTGLSTSKAGDVDVTAIPAQSLRSKFLIGGSGNLQKAFENDGEDDAAREEFIGKTINLLEAKSCSVPGVFRIVIVAQTIRDMGDTSATGSPVTRLDASGAPQTANAKRGRFDLSGGIYYDDIMSECRMLVTVEKVSYDDGTALREKLRVRQIEYLD